MRVHFFLLSLALALSLACGGSKPADPALVQEQITKATPALIDDLADATVSLDSAQGNLSLRGAAHSLHQTFPAIPELGSIALAKADLHALADFLAQHVFTAANYEGDGVYLLHGKDFCAQDSAGTPDADCVAKFDQLQLRISAQATSDALTLTLLIGPARSAPLTLVLTATSISLSLDLAEAKAAVQFIAQVAGKTIALPTRLEGVLSVSLTRNAPHDFTLAFAIDEAVHVEGALPDAQGPYAFSSEARSPLASLRINGATRTLTAALNLGPTAAQAPWAAAFPDSHATGTFALDLRGATGALTLSDGDTAARFTNLSLGSGTSTARLDAATLIGITINPDSNGAFALTVTPPPQGTSGQPLLAFDPGFDLTVAADLRPLFSAGDTIDAAWVHDTYRLTLAGTGPSVRPVEESTTFPGGLRIVTGTLTISCDTETVTVPAGQCLVGNDPIDAGENAIVGKFAAAACP